MSVPLNAARLAALTRRAATAAPLRQLGARACSTANAPPPPPPDVPPGPTATSAGAAPGAAPGDPPSHSASSSASASASASSSSPASENPLPTSADAAHDYSALLTDRAKKALIDRMVRVDHAGELGARQIYAGQLAVFRGTPVGAVIHSMAEQERAHLAAFEGLVAQRRVRPTALLPVWNVAGYALGLGTALLGKEAAMACTVAVEEVIAEHYNEQVRQLLEFDDEAGLRDLFRKFRDEELEHKDTGIEYDAERAPFYRGLSNVIKAGCRAAIYASERV